MKNNKPVVFYTAQGEHHHALTTHAEDIFHNSLWMEFEDSFIDVLSGAEPRKKYYTNEEIKVQAAC